MKLAKLKIKVYKYFKRLIITNAIIMLFNKIYVYH